MNFITYYIERIFNENERKNKMFFGIKKIFLVLFFVYIHIQTLREKNKVDLFTLYVFFYGNDILFNNLKKS